MKYEKEKQKVTWGDLSNATSAELKQKYRLSDSQLERQVRTHMDGASAGERRQLYETVYSYKNKR